MSATASSLPRLLTTMSVRAVAGMDEAKEGASPVDLYVFAYWDGVRRMARAALDVLVGRSGPDSAIRLLVESGDHIRELLSEEVSDEQGEGASGS